MKTTTTAAAGVLALATMVAAQSRCAIECFQSVITEHPPLTCTEANMYLCFCKGQDLQNYFLECAYDSCAADADAAIQFGVGLCSELGVPITVPPRTTAAPATTTPPAEPSTTADDVVETTTEEPVEEPTEEPTNGSEPSASTPGSEPSQTESDASEPTGTGITYPSVGVEESSTIVVPTPSGNGTTEPSSVPTAGAAFSGASGLVAAGFAVLAAAQLL